MSILGSRTGLWAYTHTISINQTYPVEVQTIPFNVEKIGFTAVLSEFDPQGSDPSGLRHLTSHPSFVGILSSGASPAFASLDFKTFDLGSTDISLGSGISCTRVFLFRMSDFECPTSRVSNMKVWASDMSDFLTPQNARLVFQTSKVWQSGFQFPVGSLGNKSIQMPNTFPQYQNLFRQDGRGTIHKTDDSHVSEWVYVALAASGTLPLGEYGNTLDGPTGFIFRTSFSFDNLFVLKD